MLLIDGIWGGSGLFLGILLLLFIGRHVMSPGDQRQRGYANAVAVGILLLAAINFIPTALTEAEFVGYQLFETYVVSPLDPQPETFWWLFTRAGPFQVIVRSLGMVIVLFLFLRSSSVSLAEPAATAHSGQTASLRTHWRAWITLPGENRADWTGVIIVTIGLFCYNAWHAVTYAPPTGSGPAQRPAIALLILIGTVLSGAVLGLMPEVSQSWRWLVGIATLLGLASIIGLTNLGGQAVLSGAPLLLLLGTVSLICGIGRLLRLMQYQIGTRWPTTLTVAASAGGLYLSNQLISHLV
jgi:hypothetical protein